MRFPVAPTTPKSPNSFIIPFSLCPSILSFPLFNLSNSRFFNLVHLLSPGLFFASASNQPPLPYILDPTRSAWLSACSNWTTTPHRLCFRASPPSTSSSSQPARASTDRPVLDPRACSASVKGWFPLISATCPRRGSLRVARDIAARPTTFFPLFDARLLAPQKKKLLDSRSISQDGQLLVFLS